MWSLAIVCTICFIVTLTPEFDKPKYRAVRGVMYIILGLGSGLCFLIFGLMDPYVTNIKSWIYGLGGYIYI